MVSVYVVTYWDKRYPSEPIITVFSNEEAARKMQEHIFNTDTDGNITEVPTLDECPLYDSFEIYNEEE